VPAPKAIALTALVPEEHNMIHLDYDVNDDLTRIRYYSGASNSDDPPVNGTLVATLTLVYTDNILQSVLRS